MEVIFFSAKKNRKRGISSCGWWCYKKKVSKQKLWGSTGNSLVKITSEIRRGPKSPGVLHPGMKPWEANKMNKINSCRKKPAEFRRSCVAGKHVVGFWGFQMFQRMMFQKHLGCDTNTKQASAQTSVRTFNSSAACFRKKMINCCCYMVWFWDDVGLDTMVAFLITDALILPALSCRDTSFFGWRVRNPAFRILSGCVSKAPQT